MISQETLDPAEIDTALHVAAQDMLDERDRDPFSPDRAVAALERYFRVCDVADAYHGDTSGLWTVFVEGLVAAGEPSDAAEGLADDLADPDLDLFFAPLRARYSNPTGAQGEAASILDPADLIRHVISRN